MQHGTHVASVIFGRHDSQVKGVAPQCRGLIIPVFGNGEDGSVIPCSQVDLARAITQAIQIAETENASALVINVSGGQFTPSGQAHPILADVVRNCDRNKVLIVSAAGNQGCECLHIPGAIPSVLVVGAMDQEGAPLDFSNWGGIYRKQGVLAPGEKIVGAVPSGGTRPNSGTSFATPIVSGVAALLLSLQLKRRKECSAIDIGKGILQSALGCDHQELNDCRRLLAGRLNIPGAISAVIQGASTMSDSGENKTADGGIPAQQPPAVNPQVESDVGPATAYVPSADRLSPHAATDMVMPSACSCGGNSGVPTLVYALGKLSFDYGTRARRAYFTNAFLDSKLKLTNIDNPSDLLLYLKALVPGATYAILSGDKFAHRTDITSIIWTLTIDDTPIYAIVPADPFAFETYDTFMEFLQDQVDEQGRIDQINEQLGGKKDYPTETTNVDTSQISLETGRVAVAGVIAGQLRLYTGETVPVIRPDSRGLRNWTIKVLVEAALQKTFGEGEPSENEIQVMREVAEFLNTAYSQKRNLGVAPQDRALNYAATDALVQFRLFKDKLSNPRCNNLEFDSFEVVKSPICRPDADCWDVRLYFYDPDNLQRARRVISYTIDVSDTVPVVLGRKQEYTTR